MAVRHRRVDFGIRHYKGRRVDFTRPVRVYRNLSGVGGRYSIMQNGLVVAHADTITLSDVKFIVSFAGWRRRMDTNQRNVHAFAQGLIRDSAMGSCADESDLPISIVYDPTSGPTFRTYPYGTRVTGALSVFLNEHGMSGAYIDEG
jgi:hypothetical protein